MPEPWDRPPIPKNGDRSEDSTYSAVDASSQYGSGSRWNLPTCTLALAAGYDQNGTRERDRDHGSTNSKYENETNRMSVGRRVRIARALGTTATVGKGGERGHGIRYTDKA
jgi:hypothetical protein